jgi:hypothetical protein
MSKGFATYCPSASGFLQPYRPAHRQLGCLAGLPCPALFPICVLAPRLRRRTDKTGRQRPTHTEPPWPTSAGGRRKYPIKPVGQHCVQGKGCRALGRRTVQHGSASLRSFVDSGRLVSGANISVVVLIFDDVSYHCAFAGKLHTRLPRFRRAVTRSVLQMRWNSLPASWASLLK